MFIALRRARGAGSAFLNVDYSFDDVEDPIIMAREDVVPPSFMDSFHLSLSPGKVEDYVPNDVWYLVSPRVLGVLRASRNAGDLNIVPLPTHFQRVHPELLGYGAFGVRKRVGCLNAEASDVRWSKGALEKHVEIIYDGVIYANKVPDDCDIFLLKEWPVAPIIREAVARRLQELKVTGFSFQPFKVV